MKKALTVLLLPLAVLLLGGCATSSAPAAGASKAPKQLGVDQILPFVHIDGFGTETPSPAWLAWEFEAQGYVKYQITYTSCTCRQESINVKSTLYIEISKQGSKSRIKNLYFHYWGDSPVTPAGQTRDEIEKTFMAKMPGMDQKALADVDIITGATVTTINLKQIGAAILDYHKKNYPQDSGIEVEIGPDAVTGATAEE